MFILSQVLNNDSPELSRGQRGELKKGSYKVSRKGAGGGKVNRPRADPHGEWSFCHHCGRIGQGNRRRLKGTLTTTSANFQDRLGMLLVLFSLFLLIIFLKFFFTVHDFYYHLYLVHGFYLRHSFVIFIHDSLIFLITYCLLFMILIMILLQIW